MTQVRRYCYRRRSIPIESTDIKALWGYPSDGSHQTLWDHLHDRAHGWSFLSEKGSCEPMFEFELHNYSKEIRTITPYSSLMNTYFDEFSDEDVLSALRTESTERLGKFNSDLADFNKFIRMEKSERNRVIMDANERLSLQISEWNTELEKEALFLDETDGSEEGPSSN